MKKLISAVVLGVASVGASAQFTQSNPHRYVLALDGQVVLTSPVGVCATPSPTCNFAVHDTVTIDTSSGFDGTFFSAGGSLVSMTAPGYFSPVSSWGDSDATVVVVNGQVQSIDRYF